MKHPLFTAAALVAGLAFASAVMAQPAGGGGFREACGADLAKFCPDAKPGPGGGMRECIQANQAKFSDACKAALAAFQANRPQGGPPPQQGGGTPPAQGN